MGLFGKDKTENKTTPASQEKAPAVDIQGRVVRSSTMSSASLLHSEAKTTSPKPAFADDLPKMVNDVNFSDLYITPDKKSYIWSGKSNSGLKVGKFIDIQDFITAVEEKYDGKTAVILCVTKEEITVLKGLWHLKENSSAHEKCRRKFLIWKSWEFPAECIAS